MKRLPSWITVLPSLVVPVSIGLSLYLGLQHLIDSRVIVDETVLRYLTGHPVSKITVAMFFVGVASLLVLGWNLVGQFSGENNISLGEATDTKQTNDVREQAVDHGQFLLDLPNRYHSHYLWDRLVAAVHAIYRTGSTASVEDELKYLSDMEQERQQQRYSLVRILIWATPMLGFLGTVLGISQALGGIAIGPDNDFQQMMNGLRGSLYIAFDTTALALTLSMLMMFGLFLVERFDSQLLRLVDQRAHSEIAKHYEITTGSSFDSAQIVQAIQAVVVSQTEIWRESIRKAEQAWTSTLTQTSDIVRGQLSESLDENIAAMAHYLGEAIDKADMSISHRWSQWQVSLSENARLMEQHLLTLGIQTKSVERIVNSLDESTAFEQAMKHQQNAVMATTRTHRVLNELLDKVQEAKLAERMLEPAELVPAQSNLMVAGTTTMAAGAMGVVGQAVQELPVSYPMSATLSDTTFGEVLPVAEETAAEETAAEETAAEETVAEETVAEETVEPPVAEEPVAEPSKAESNTLELRIKQPAAVEAIADEPVAEQTADDQPVAEEQATAAVADTETDTSETSSGEDERTLVLIFSTDDSAEAEQAPVQQQVEEQSEPVADSPKVKIFGAEQASQEIADQPIPTVASQPVKKIEEPSTPVRDYSSLLVDANPAANKPAEVPIEEIVAAQTKQIEEAAAKKAAQAIKPELKNPTPLKSITIPDTKPKSNQSRSAKIARALTEDATGETEQPSVTFRAKVQKPDSEDGKRAA